MTTALSTEILSVAPMEEREFDQSELDVVIGEYTQLKFEYDCDLERSEKILKRLELSAAEICSRVDTLRIRLRTLLEQIPDGDLESDPEREAASALLDALDGDTSHTSTLLEDAADAAQEAEEAAKLKRLYRKLCFMLHSDKTHNKNTEELFLEVVAAYKARDLAALTVILSLLDGNRDAKLIDAYKRRIAQVHWEYDQLRQTRGWYYLTVNLEEGYETALSLFKTDLIEVIESLEDSINRMCEV